MCKINAFNTQTVSALILQIGGSVRIGLWICADWPVDP